RAPPVRQCGPSQLLYSVSLSCCVLCPSFFILLCPPPSSTLFPYTTLFRSEFDTSFVRYVFNSLKSPAKVIDYNVKTEESIIVNRSEEHTSELQSRFDLVCRLLLEKKKHAQYHLDR